MNENLKTKARSPVKKSTKEPFLTVVGGAVKTTSLNVAGNFGKKHFHVLRDIEALECPKKFTESNFGLSEYTDPTGRKLPMYSITRDGFTILAMGFTGKKAMGWKIKYINGFNLMEKRLLEHQKKAFAPPAGLTPAQQRQVQLLVKKKAWDLGGGNKPNKSQYQKIYGGIKDHFLVATYSQVPQSRYDELVRFLGGDPTKPINPQKALQWPDPAKVERERVARVRSEVRAIDAELCVSQFDQSIDYAKNVREYVADVKKDLEGVEYWLDSLDFSLGFGLPTAKKVERYLVEMVE